MVLKVIDFKAADAPQQFAASLRDIGFGVLKNHPLDHKLIEKAYADWYGFFRSDEADKQQYLFDPKTHNGYVPTDLSETAKGFEIKDLKEFYHYYLGGICPETLRGTTDQLFKSMSGLAQQLLGWVEANMPADISSELSMPLADMVDGSELTLLRFLHYPPLTGDEDPKAIRAAAHEDINLLTILPAATAKGLQVLSNSGEWLDVPCDPNWVIVNTGDMLDECTQGYYKATSHRVINPEGEDASASRLSMPLFLHPNETVQLSKRHTAGSYRAERFAELGLD